MNPRLIVLARSWIHGRAHYITTVIQSWCQRPFRRKLSAIVENFGMVFPGSKICSRSVNQHLSPNKRNLTDVRSKELSLSKVNIWLLTFVSYREGSNWTKVQLNINSKALVAHMDRDVWRQPGDDLSYLATINTVYRSHKYFWSPSPTSTWR